MLRGPHDLNLNIRTGDGRLPPKNDTVTRQRLFLFHFLCLAKFFKDAECLGNSYKI